MLSLAVTREHSPPTRNWMGYARIGLVPILFALNLFGHITHHVLERNTKVEIKAALAQVIREDPVK